MANEPPELLVADATAWRQWLDHNVHSPAGVWLRLAKKGTTEPTSLSYAQALDEALCYGWIDGQRRPGDQTTFLQRFTPRRAGSRWSARNTVIVSRLVADARMQPAGLVEVNGAKGDGRWDAAYASAATIEVPADLAAALRAEPSAEDMFGTLTSQNRYAVLYRIEAAKRSQTRARHIEQFVAMLARGETPYPQNRRR